MPTLLYIIRDPLFVRSYSRVCLGIARTYGPRIGSIVSPNIPVSYPVRCLLYMFSSLMHAFFGMQQGLSGG